MEKKCTLTWKDIVTFFSYMRLKDPNGSAICTYSEIEIFAKSIKNTASQLHVDLVISEKYFKDAISFVCSQPYFFSQLAPAPNYKGFYIQPHVSHKTIYRSFMTQMSVADYELLKLAYECRYDD